MPPRIGIIGPSRRHNGTGPFVAGFFRRSGCEVELWDRAKAQALLDRQASRPAVDAVAICSPAETHSEYLIAAVQHGLHVFCEKPIIWPRGHSVGAFAALIATLARTLAIALDDGLVIHENTQWVYTLNDFSSLAGDPGPNGVTRFRCELSPVSHTPADMLMECSAHANSLAVALGCSGVEDPRISFSPCKEGSPAALDCRFRSRQTGGNPVAVEYRFSQQPAQPRHAAYEVNGCRVERKVDLNGYRISLVCGSRELPVRDPLQSSVEDFVTKVLTGSPGRFSKILANIRMSAQLLAACRNLAPVPHA